MLTDTPRLQRAIFTNIIRIYTKCYKKKYKNINRKRIYNEKVYDTYRIVLDGYDEKAFRRFPRF